MSNGVASANTRLPLSGQPSMAWHASDPPRPPPQPSEVPDPDAPVPVEEPPSPIPIPRDVPPEPLRA
ncbi:MAG: hypothetical protein P4L71_18850 [Acetobacteraceae bacterium]|nr:hypothetical protein [Acetobacteraceae bacterium]